MIRCVRLWTGDDDNSHFEEGVLEFEPGAHFILHPGDILYAEDTAGGGHRWKLTDDQPWRRAYVILAPGVPVPFKPTGKVQ